MSLPQLVFTLTDDEFAVLAVGDDALRFTCRIQPGITIEAVIQREGRNMDDDPLSNRTSTQALLNRASAAVYDYKQLVDSGDIRDWADEVAIPLILEMMAYTLLQSDLLKGA